MIKGLFETHLFVENLENSIDFYSNVLKLEKCRVNDDRRVAFFWIGKPQQSFLGIWEMPKEQIDKRHFAFECEPDWILNESINFLKSNNLKYWNFLKEDSRKPMVFPWVPAVSIYFEDPDGHLLEFIGKLPEEAQPESEVCSYDVWINTISPNKK